MSRVRAVRVGIDTGGTFTDVVAVDEETGEIVTTKTPSTPADPSEAFMAGLRKVLTGLGDVHVTSVIHGTTVATNHLLEGRVGPLGFVTTEGFEFLLEIARQSVPDGYGNSYFWVKPPRIVAADLVRTVGGRLDHTGAELRRFDEAGARAVARWLRERGIGAVGVCFLHAYANPDHERRMRAVLAEEHPDALVSISSDVLREYREYERAVTTLVDAAVKPTVSAYVATVRDRLAEFTPVLMGRSAGSAPVQARASAPQAPPTHLLGTAVPFSIMKSNGGVLSAGEVVNHPITTVLSGPAAGALGAALVARTAGFDRVLTLDGGGTSTDVSVVLDGEPTLTTEGSVGPYPSKIPMIDIVTVGAGGGSVGWLSPEATLRVGPRSAGADPGPMCYGRGGTEPTVTDAHLVFGRIPPHLLGGEVPLDRSAAEEGLAALGSALGMDVGAVAAGMLEISAWNQANALRQITVQRGLDVRDFVLTTFGGSGSLLACRLMDILGLRAVVVPRDPGNLSAFGLLSVDVRNDYVRTHVVRHGDLDLGELQIRFDALHDQAGQALRAEGFDPDRQRHARSADLRYVGQAFEVRVPVPAGPLGLDAADAVVAAFHDAHERLYGYCFRDRPEQPVEWVNLRVTGIGPIRRPRLPESEPDSRVPEPSGRRPVRFGGDTGSVDTPTYRRADLRTGQPVAGPAVVEEYGATVPLHPGFTAEPDRFGNLVVRRG